MVRSVPHPAGENIALVGSPLALARTPPVPPSAPPRLGEHTAATLGELLSYDTERLERLAKKGAILLA
jgi:crotonobetainyl-CoA:carnitine CoA-transferase CaiB-like acyl-CoA transferase